MLQGNVWLTLLYNHIAPKFSDLERQMVVHVPPGGNWSNIPSSVPSKRLEQIRRNGGGRTTYYGRLCWGKPSYTISTYFNRIGNGCHIHPEQNRLISIREGARLQSFPDSYRFLGSKGAIYKQIGNAVPPLLGYVISKHLSKYVKGKAFIDLFAGAGGLSEGFRMNGLNPIAAIEMEKPYFDTYIENLNPTSKDGFIHGDICEQKNQNKIADVASSHKIEIITGGPPCQGFSLAGWYNKNDLRNQLFKEFVKLVSRISPKFFIMENVLGMLSMDNGQFIKKIIKDFESIGYHVNEPWKLNAANYGVPQKRKRIFIIGSSKKLQMTPPEPILDEEHFITVKDAIYGLPHLEAGEGQEIMSVSIKPRSEYQKYLMQKITAEEFYTKIQKTCIVI